mmetsp:Transcript_36673/g.146623  ORF Transcript_36673/g.146623 Transcript_36673/m.146623 type:complete len:93 (-) Transcript_36673:3448-3726(-)
MEHESFIDEAFREQVVLLRTQYGARIKSYQSDNALEYEGMTPLPGKADLQPSCWRLPVLLIHLADEDELLLFGFGFFSCTNERRGKAYELMG